MQYVWRDRVAQALRKFMYLATTLFAIGPFHPSSAQLPNSEASLCMFLSFTGSGDCSGILGVKDYFFSSQKQQSPVNPSYQRRCTGTFLVRFQVCI